jgi:hypothetical protein
LVAVKVARIQDGILGRAGSVEAVCLATLELVELVDRDPAGFLRSTARRELRA